MKRELDLPRFDRMEKARSELKGKFERWGLADLIDWTDRS